MDPSQNEIATGNWLEQSWGFITTNYETVSTWFQGLSDDQQLGVVLGTIFALVITVAVLSWIIPRAYNYLRDLIRAVCGKGYQRGQRDVQRQATAAGHVTVSTDGLKKMVEEAVETKLGENPVYSAVAEVLGDVSELDDDDVERVRKVLSREVGDVASSLIESEGATRRHVLAIVSDTITDSDTTEAVFGTDAFRGTVRAKLEAGANTVVDTVLGDEDSAAAQHLRSSIDTVIDGEIDSALASDEVTSQITATVESACVTRAAELLGDMGDDDEYGSEAAKTLDEGVGGLLEREINATLESDPFLTRIRGDVSTAATALVAAYIGDEDKLGDLAGDTTDALIRQAVQDALANPSVALREAASKAVAPLLAQMVETNAVQRLSAGELEGELRAIVTPVVTAAVKEQLSSDNPKVAKALTEVISHRVEGIISGEASDFLDDLPDSVVKMVRGLVRDEVNAQFSSDRSSTTQAITRIVGEHMTTWVSRNAEEIVDEAIPTATGDLRNTLVGHLQRISDRVSEMSADGSRNGFATA